MTDIMEGVQFKFNSGYWNGVADERAGRVSMHERNGVSDAEHFDQVYVRGYRAGRQDVQTNAVEDTSEAAFAYYGDEACEASPVYPKAGSIGLGCRFTWLEGDGRLSCEHCHRRKPA